MNKLMTIVVLAFSVCFFSVVTGAEDKDVALVLKTAGKVQINKSGSRSWQNTGRGHRLGSGEVVRTGKNSLAALVFTDDKSLLKVRANSNVTINGKRENNSIIKQIKIGFGEIWAKVTKQNTRMRVESPSGVATVKGTEFNCLVTDGQFLVFCQEGLMELVNQFGTMLLGANEMARLTPNTPPQRMQGDPNDIFNLSDEGEKESLEIEFEDADGNKKSLIIDFE